MDIEWMSVFAVVAVAVPLVLGVALLVHSIPFFVRMAYRHIRVKRSGIKYDPIAGEPRMPQRNSATYGYTSIMRAQELAGRVLGVHEDCLKYASKGFSVTGGATGHTYRILPRAVFPIVDLTSRELLCGKPYNAWSLPLADTMLTQALYLQCPETERAFVALCNKTAAPSVAFTL